MAETSAEELSMETGQVIYINENGLILDGDDEVRYILPSSVTLERDGLFIQEGVPLTHYLVDSSAHIEDKGAILIQQAGYAEIKDENSPEEHQNMEGDSEIFQVTEDNELGEVAQVVLNEEQCRMLQGCGRVLLQEGSRRFLLDGDGLRELDPQIDSAELQSLEYIVPSQDNEGVAYTSPDDVQIEYETAPVEESDDVKIDQNHSIIQHCVVENEEDVIKVNQFNNDFEQVNHLTIFISEENQQINDGKAADYDNAIETSNHDENPEVSNHYTDTETSNNENPEISCHYTDTEMSNSENPEASHHYGDTETSNNEDPDASHHYLDAETSNTENPEASHHYIDTETSNNGDPDASHHYIDAETSNNENPEMSNNYADAEITSLQVTNYENPQNESYEVSRGPSSLKRQIVFKDCKAVKRFRDFEDEISSVKIARNVKTIDKKIMKSKRIEAKKIVIMPDFSKLAEGTRSSPTAHKVKPRQDYGTNYVLLNKNLTEDKIAKPQVSAKVNSKIMIGHTQDGKKLFGRIISFTPSKETKASPSAPPVPDVSPESAPPRDVETAKDARTELAGGSQEKAPARVKKINKSAKPRSKKCNLDGASNAGVSNQTLKVKSEKEDVGYAVQEKDVKLVNSTIVKVESPTILNTHMLSRIQSPLDSSTDQFVLMRKEHENVETVDRVSYRLDLEGHLQAIDSVPEQDVFLSLTNVLSALMKMPTVQKQLSTRDLMIIKRDGDSEKVFIGKMLNLDEVGPPDWNFIFMPELSKHYSEEHCDKDLVLRKGNFLVIKFVKNPNSTMYEVTIMDKVKLADLKPGYQVWNSAKCVNTVNKSRSFRKNCPVCKKVFYRTSNLSRHMSIHAVNNASESEGHACSFCNCAFRFSSTLTRHILQCHTDTSNAKAKDFAAHVIMQWLAV